VVHDFKTRIKEVGDRNQRYRTGVERPCRDPNEVVDSRALVIFQKASELVGIDEPKNELISLLTKDGSSSQHQVKVVSVVGFGGLGKTTLANQVFQSLHNEFDCHAFVTVSRNPDMMKVLRTILSDVSGEEYTNTEAGDIQHLVKKISNFLQDKRYVSKLIIRLVICSVYDYINDSINSKNR
jgi:disease resistance protein RPM1